MMVPGHHGLRWSGSPLERNVPAHDPRPEGVEHGYAIPDRDVFDKQAAERDWELIFAMYHRQLRPYTGALV